MNTHEAWNQKIDDRRLEANCNQSPFKKGDFSANSPDYPLPKDIYAHPTVQAAEQFFVDKRNQYLSAKQLQALNGIQNNMRNKLAQFPCMHHVTDYRDNKPTREYVAAADALDPELVQYGHERWEMTPENNLGWKVVHVAATEYMEQAKKI